MNTRLLRRVAKHIAEEPRRLNMGFLYRPATHFDNDLRPPCGTVGCIAGWALIIGLKATKFDDCFPVVSGKTVDVTDARKLLKVDNDNLFFLHYWPVQFKAAYSAAHTPAERANATVARIEWFIKTKGRE